MGVVGCVAGEGLMLFISFLPATEPPTVPIAVVVAVAVVIVAVVIGVLVAIGIGCFCWWRTRRGKFTPGDL